MAVGAVAVVVVLGVAIAAFYYDRAAKAEPVEAMESFLQAVNGGDIDDAFRFMSDRAISAHHDESLDPATYASDWEIGEIDLVDYNRLGINSTATVSAEIIAPDRTHISEEFYLQNSEEGWVVSNPYSSIGTSVGNFGHLHINGQEPETPTESQPNGVRVLPGAYSFDDPGVDLIELEYDSVLTIGQERTFANSDISDIDVEVESPAEPAETSTRSLFGLRDDAHEEAQSRVESYLDNCVTDRLVNIGCPISVSPNDLNATADDDLTFDESSAQWVITQMPEVEMAYNPDDFDEPLLSFDNGTAGEAELTVATDESGSFNELVFQCSIGVDLLEPTLEFDGEVYIGPLEDPRDRPRTDQPVDNMGCELANLRQPVPDLRLTTRKN